MIVCGTGNNGADGLALARILKLWKWTVSVLIIGDKDCATEEWKTQYDLCRKLKVRETKLFAEADIIADAIFGIGLSREITGDALYAIQRMNARKGFKLAIDVPSGISCSTGAVIVRRPAGTHRPRRSAWLRTAFTDCFPHWRTPSAAAPCRPKRTAACSSGSTGRWAWSSNAPIPA